MRCGIVLLVLFASACAQEEAARSTTVDKVGGDLPIHLVQQGEPDEEGRVEVSLAIGVAGAVETLSASVLTADGLVVEDAPWQRTWPKPSPGRVQATIRLRVKADHGLLVVAASARGPSGRLRRGRADIYCGTADAREAAARADSEAPGELIESSNPIVPRIGGGAGK